MATYRSKQINGLVAIKIGNKIYLPPPMCNYIAADNGLYITDKGGISMPLRLATIHYFCVEKETSECKSILFFYEKIT